MSRAIIVVMEDNERGMPYQTVECKDRAAAEALLAEFEEDFYAPSDGGYRDSFIVDDAFKATYDEATFRAERAEGAE
jgi:hypothetical protein